MKYFVYFEITEFVKIKDPSKTIIIIVDCVTIETVRKLILSHGLDVI